MQNLLECFSDSSLEPSSSKGALGTKNLAITWSLLEIQTPKNHFRLTDS